MNIGSSSQPTDFALDVLGRYVCNTFDEALANSDPAFRANARDANGNGLPPRGDMRPFDFIIIGGGTFGSAVAEHLWFRATGRSERILALEAGPVPAYRAHAKLSLVQSRTRSMGRPLAI